MRMIKTFMQVIKNIRLLYSLEKRYNCKTGLKFIIERHSRGTAIKLFDGRRKATIRFDVLASPMFETILMHEIGHCVEPNGFDNNDIVAELAAWNFVLREKNSFSPLELGSMYEAFSSYLPLEDRFEDRAFYLNTFTKLINYHIFGVEE